jgi:DNA-binding Lrp family transcriptional regulator
LRIAFVFIVVEPGAEMEVLERLRHIPEVREAYFVYGVYDLVAKVETDAIDHLKEIITYKIRKLDKVTSTTTTVVM